MKTNGQDQYPAAIDSTEAFELALKETDKGSYLLRLYVSGMTPNSVRAIENVRRLCSVHLEGRYQLEIIDIYQQPGIAKEGQIVAAPTLIKELPPPICRFIGDMSKTEKILLRMDVKPAR